MEKTCLKSSGENEPFEDMKENAGLRLTPKNADENGGDST